VEINHQNSLINEILLDHPVIKYVNILKTKINKISLCFSLATSMRPVSTVSNMSENQHDHVKIDCFFCLFIYSF